MKISKYGRSMKFAIAVAEIFLATLSAVCVGIVSCNAVINVRTNTMEINYYISPFSKTAAFEDSDVFNDMVYDNLNDVIRYGVIRGQLETDGRFDETKEIDIEQFARHFEEVPVVDTSVRYRLGDLIQWGQSGETVTLRAYTYQEAEDMIAQAHGKDVSKKDMSDEDGIAEHMDQPHMYSGTDNAVAEEVYVEMSETDTVAAAETVLEAEEESGTLRVTYEDNTAEDTRYVDIPVERYLPVDGQSILAHVDSVEELEEMVFYLSETVRMLEQNYKSYRAYREYFDQTESSFLYYILQEDGTSRNVYTNLQTDEMTREEIDAYFTSMGRHLAFKPADFSYETDMFIREEQVRNIWNSFQYGYPDDTSVWIGIDTAFPYEDAFRNARESYLMAAPGYLYILLSVLCGVVSLVLFGLMTHMAGKKQGREGITLLWFDRWHTETAALAACIVTGMLFFMTGLSVTELYWNAEERQLMLAALALGTALTFGSFLFFWLSLVRRVKARVFWTNFLIYRLLLRLKRMIMMIYDDSRIVIRVWIPYLLFAGINMVLASSGLAIAACILDIFVGMFLYRNNKTRNRILEGIGNIRDGNLDYQIEVDKMHGDNRILAEAVNSIGNGIRQAVETSVKDERMKADLITNVSHDIKTPLTSIINYVDLIKREPMENEKIKGYLEVLDSKSQRLKQLTEDLVEVSKISSGNIVLQCEKLDLVELMNQTIGEFSEKLEEKNLQLVASMEEGPLLIFADSRRIWRVMENLFNNACKYALEHTRVYVELKEMKEEKGPGSVRLSVKNISEQPLRVGIEDLTERFIRGDVARTTEGSGLGLSIAKNLTELQKGKFEIVSDGDLFKVVITFPLVLS